MIDMKERRIVLEEGETVVRNHEGLIKAFELGAQGLSDREIAISLNAVGYRTTGTHGPRPFTKDTVNEMLKNRFYLGEIPDGNGGWLKAKHLPMVSHELFERIRVIRENTTRRRATINTSARTYSFSGLALCSRCGGTIRMQTSPKGKARVYCASRVSGYACDFKGTFLEIYEKQIAGYLKEFFIPEDFREKIMEEHRTFCSTYDNQTDQRRSLESSMVRLKEQYRWGHIGKAEYLGGFQRGRIPTEATGTDRDWGKSP